MESNNKIGNVLKLLLALFASFSLYSLFSTNTSLSELKANLTDAQMEVRRAKDSVRLVQAQMDGLLKITQGAKAQVVVLEQKTNQVKGDVENQKKKDAHVVTQATQIFQIMQEKKALASNLEW